MHDMHITWQIFFILLPKLHHRLWSSYILRFHAWTIAWLLNTEIAEVGVFSLFSFKNEYKLGGAWVSVWCVDTAVLRFFCSFTANLLLFSEIATLKLLHVCQRCSFILRVWTAWWVCWCLYISFKWQGCGMSLGGWYSCGGISLKGVGMCKNLKWCLWVLNWRGYRGLMLSHQPSRQQKALHAHKCFLGWRGLAF